MNKSMTMHGGGTNVRDMMRMMHGKCFSGIMECNSYPVPHKISPHCDINAGRRNEFVRRTMIFNRYC